MMIEGVRQRASGLALCLLVLMGMATPILVLGQENYEGRDIYLAYAAYGSETDFPDHIGKQEVKHLTVLGLQIGRTTLEEAKKYLGPTPRAYVGMGGHDSPFVCYRSASPGDDTVLTLSFDDRYHSQLNGYQIIDGSERFKALTQCGRSTLVSRALTSQGGVKLGLTRTQVQSIWGVPVTSVVSKGNHLLIHFSAYEERQRDDGTIQCALAYSRVIARFTKIGLSWVEVNVSGEVDRIGRCTEAELSGEKQRANRRK